MHAELQVERPVSLLHVETPTFVSVEVKTGQVTRAHEHPNVFAIGGRRRRREVSFGGPESDRTVTRGKLSPPQLLAIGAYAEQQQIGLVRRRQEDVVFPDDRGGPGGTGQR